MKDSHIAWTDDTNNPIIVKGGGFICIKVSEGCKHCYAEVVNKRICGYQGVKAYDFKVTDPFPELELKQGMLDGWAKKKKSRKIFVSSMTDVFGEFVPEEWIFKILDAMVAAPRQIFQVLTKRSARMKEVVFKYCQLHGINVLPKNIWLIVSIENQGLINRAYDLIGTRCSVRGLSIEPLLASIDLTMLVNVDKWVEYAPPALKGIYGNHMLLDTTVIDHIDWVIVGGESGNKARMMDPEWAYSLQRQCKEHDVPFFFKQWGEWVGGKLDMRKGMVMLEDGDIFWTGTLPIIHNWHRSADGTEYNILVSSRVGKKERKLVVLEGCKNVSDNALLQNKHHFEFPHYLNSK